MNSIRFNEPPGLEIDLDVEPGQQYQLQLLFAEGCCDRGFDITVEDELLVDNLVVQVVQDGINNPLQGVVFADQVSAADGELNIALGGSNPWAGDNNPILNGLTLKVAEGLLQPGDSDQNGQFDQLDLVKVQIAAKYLTGQAATWGEGDWDGAPAGGGVPGSPPAGDNLFDQIDIIAALNAGLYLTGPYLAVGSNGQEGDDQTSIRYDANTGDIAVDAPNGIELTSINIDSASGIFTGEPAQNLGGSFDNDADTNIFKATFGSSFGSLSFGNVAQAGLSEEFVLNDLSVVGSLAGGGALGDVDLIYVPEPASLGLAFVGLLSMLAGRRRKNS